MLDLRHLVLLAFLRLLVSVLVVVAMAVAEVAGRNPAVQTLDHMFDYIARKLAANTGESRCKIAVYCSADRIAEMAGFDCTADMAVQVEKFVRWAETTLLVGYMVCLDHSVGSY